MQSSSKDGGIRGKIQKNNATKGQVSDVFLSLSTKYLPLAGIGFCVIYFLWEVAFYPIREYQILGQRLLADAMGAGLCFLAWYMFNRL